MADEILKRILYEITADAQQAIQEQQEFRSNIESTKIAFRELQAASGESFDVIKTQIETATVTPLTQELGRLKAKLKELQSGEFGEIINTSGAETQIKQIQSQIQSVKVAFRELRQEASQITPPITTATENAQIFTANVAAARAEMLELVNAGFGVQAAFEGVKQTGLFSPTELAAAKKQILEITKLQERLNINQQTSTERARQFTTNVAAAKAQMLQLVQAGFSLKAALTGVDTGAFTRGELTEALKEVKVEMGEVGEATTQTSNILRRIFAAGIIGFVLQALRGLIDGIREATEAGAELSRSFLDIAVNARALRREGGELLPSEWITRAKELSEVFTQFAQQDINSAVSQLVRLGRQAGLTGEEIQGLIDQTLVLATVTGQDAAVAANAVATAVESGYARGLKELVGAIDETTIAQEAIRRGMAETEDEVDKNMRALVVLTLLQEEAAKVGGDLALVQESLSGKYNENRKDVDDLRAELGEKFLPVIVSLQEAWLGILETLDEAAVAFTKLYVIVTAFTNAVEGLAQIKLRGFFTGAEAELTFVEAYRMEFERLADELHLFSPDDVIDKVENLSDAFRNAIPDIEELKNALKDAFIDIREIFIDIYNDISDETQKFVDDEIDEWDKYQFDLQKLADKLQFDTAKIWRQYYDDVAEANDDYRDNELESEKDYQEDLRKLRENFLFNLEDALRERDARQIMRLTRQFNLRKKQLGREYELDKAQRKREFDDQLQDIQRQRDIRLRELAYENAQRRQQMEEEYQFEKALREREHQRQLAEERERAEERLAELLRQLQDEGTITETEAKLLAAVFDKFFGTNGEIDMTLDEFIDNLEATAEEAARQLQVIRQSVQDIEPITTTPIIPDPAPLYSTQEPQEIITTPVIDLELDPNAVSSEAQAVTNAIESEFGTDGTIAGIYDTAEDAASTFVQEQLPQSLADDGGEILKSSSKIAESLNTIFGPKGEVEVTFTYLVELINGAVNSVIQAIQRLVATLRSLSGISVPTVSGPKSNPIPMAKGGTIIASSPTTVTFGEAGPEMAQFTPLNKSGQRLPGGVGGGSPSKQDMVSVLVSLSEGLEAEIINKSLGQVADVIVDTNRQRL